GREIVLIEVYRLVFLDQAGDVMARLFQKVLKGGAGNLADQSAQAADDKIHLVGIDAGAILGIFGGKFGKSVVGHGNLLVLGLHALSASRNSELTTEAHRTEIKFRQNNFHRAMTSAFPIVFQSKSSSLILILCDSCVTVVIDLRQACYLRSPS